MVFERRGIIKMSKLQRIKRADGTESYSCNIPIALIKELNWKKSDKLTLESKYIGEQMIVIIVNEDIRDGRD